MVKQIVLQDSAEDSTVYNNSSEKPGKDMEEEELKGVHDADGDRRSESEHYDRFPQTFNGHQREMGSRRTSHAPGGEGSMPPESPLHYNSNSRLRSPINPAGSCGAHRGGRYAVNCDQIFTQCFVFIYTLILFTEKEI